MYAELADVKCPRSIDSPKSSPAIPRASSTSGLLKDEYWAATGRQI